MEWSNTLSVSRLFLTHEIDIHGPDGDYIVHIPSLREYLSTSFYVQFVQLFNIEQIEKWRTLNANLNKGLLLQTLMTDPLITNLKEFSFLSQQLHNNITLILPTFNIKERQLFCDNSPLTDEALTEILYVLQLGCGAVIEKPMHFGPDEEAAKRFYERAQAAKARAAQIKAENPRQGSVDGLMQMFVLISYRFPYQFEQMYDMTIMQLHYLQRMSSQIIGYEHNMSAYTSGNLKKAPKFFLQ